MFAYGESLLFCTECAARSASCFLFFGALTLLVGWQGGGSGLQKIPHQQSPKFLLWKTYAGPGLSWSKV